MYKDNNNESFEIDALAYIKKAYVTAGGPFCGVRRRPKFLGRFTQFCPLRPNFWVFLRSFAHRRLKNWISVGDRITRLFPFMLPGMLDYYHC